MLYYSLHLVILKNEKIGLVLKYLINYTVFSNKISAVALNIILMNSTQINLTLSNIAVHIPNTY